MLFPNGQTVLSKSKKISENNGTSSRSLYLNNCARCHGADGRGNTRLGRSLNVPDLTSRKVQKMRRSKIARVIKYGENEMPAFGKKLNKKQINSIADYVRALN